MAVVTGGSPKKARQVHARKTKSGLHAPATTAPATTAAAVTVVKGGSLKKARNARKTRKTRKASKKKVVSETALRRVRAPTTIRRQLAVNPDGNLVKKKKKKKKKKNETFGLFLIDIASFIAKFKLHCGTWISSH